MPKKTIFINDNQDLFLKKNCYNLSRMVQRAIDELIRKEKEQDLLLKQQYPPLVLIKKEGLTNGETQTF